MVRTFDYPIITNDQSIDRVLAAGLPVALVFLDGKASPALEQSMERLARENAGALLLAQVRVKDSPATARRYQVKQTPSVITLRQNEVVTRAESPTGDELAKHVAYLLGKGPRPEAPRPADGGRATQAGTTGRPQTVTDATFDREVIRSSQPVLVDFWAPWCGPCRMTEPVIEKLAQEMAGALRVAKVNVDENPLSAQRYGVQSIPTMLVVKNGQVIDRWAGALPEAAMRSRVSAALSR